MTTSFIVFALLLVMFLWFYHAQDDDWNGYGH